LLLVIATGVTTAALFLLIVFGGPLGEAIADQAHLGSAWNWVWGLFRWPLAFFAILVFFAFVYYLAPNQTQRDWKWITPGSVIGALFWLAISGLFALYTSFSDSYDKTYGSLAGGIILLLWLYYSACALLFGAELNAELDRQADIHASGGPQAGLIDHARRMR
jgi:membrane protein